MMENLLVLIVVAVAAIFVGRRLWLNLRTDRPTCCGSCTGCTMPTGGSGNHPPCKDHCN